MAFTLAVAGKGGTGKTTLAALLIQTLIERGEGPVLAVDADPNPNLGYVLGYQVEKTISELRDELLDQIRKLPPGVTKNDYLEMGIQECLWEGRGVDLLVRVQARDLVAVVRSTTFCGDALTASVVRTGTW